MNEFSSLDGAILDWQYEPSVDERVWTKVTEERSYRLVVATNGASVATRQVGDGEVRRIKETTYRQRRFDNSLEATNDATKDQE